MVRILYLLFALIVMAIGFAFAVLNDEPVRVNFYYVSRAMPLSLALVSALFVGSALGLIASLAVIVRQKREMGRLRREMKIAEQEINNLRAIPMRDG